MRERRAGALVAGLGAPMLASGALLGAAALVLGRPNLPLAAGFFANRAPTMASAVAASVLLVWLIILTALISAVAASLVTLLAAVAASFEGRRRQQLWGGLVLAAGLVILAVGAGRHYQSSQVDMHGGSLTEARQQLQSTPPPDS